MSPSPEQPSRNTTRSRRSIHIPARYIDYLPTSVGLRHAPPPVPLTPPQPSTRAPSPDPVVHSAPPLIEYRTQPNDMGLFRVYPNRPTHIPSRPENIRSFVDAPTLEMDDTPSATIRGLADAQITQHELYSAFSSPTAGILMCWQYTGTTSKSGAELNRLWSFIKDPRFQPSVHDTFNHEREKKLVEKYLHAEYNPFKTNHGWTMSSVTVKLPHERSSWSLGEDDPSIPVLKVNGVHHRDLVDIIITTLQDPIASTFHMTPFAEYWQPDLTSNPIRVFGEVYSSPEHLNSYQKVHSLPRDPGDDLERIVIPLMLWSDATQLVNFGDASLWPIYLFFGNQSKYI